jgi:hypothetical protein
MSETRREAFSIGNGPNAYNDSAYADKWLGVRNEDGATSVARLTGGYKTTEHPGYTAFPKQPPAPDEAGSPIPMYQGELFNWEHPQIKGLYRGDGSSKLDLGAVLGMAVNESKNRWGVEPIEDEQLSEESAELTKKLTGRDKPVNYHRGYGKDESRDYGNTMARIVDTRAKDSGGQALPASDIEEGSKTIRDKVAELRKAKKQSSKNTMPNESRVSAFKQTIIPGMETIG